jgi:large subunit ribosomal protein L21
MRFPHQDPQLPRIWAFRLLCVVCGEVTLEEERMKYAIVESGGKQYRAEEGGQISVDRLSEEVGTQVELGDVLLVSDNGSVTVGKPLVDGVKVKATITDQYKDKKVLVFKYKSGNNYRRKKGHRQQYTRLQIDEIVTG